MEYNENGHMSEFYNNNGWGFDSFPENPNPIPPNSSFENYPLPIDYQTLTNCSSNELYSPFGDEFSAPELITETPPPPPPPLFPTPWDYSTLMMDDEEPSLMGTELQSLEFQAPFCKMDPIYQSPDLEVPGFNMGRKGKAKKVEGQPSKNLMAERRRRKRLNDRLSMLRSVVPKISKMDRTSILADTIDYMKELLERIKILQEEIDEEGSTSLNLMSFLRDAKPNEMVIRNSPKFDVERREIDTRIDISCGGKPRLLLSTLTTLEALGLEIEQCVISCFNDFSMQASCSEEMEQRSIISSEDVKQALFQNAGYGGRCL